MALVWEVQVASIQNKASSKANHIYTNVQRGTCIRMNHDWSMSRALLEVVAGRSRGSHTVSLNGLSSDVEVVQLRR